MPHNSDGPTTTKFAAVRFNGNLNTKCAKKSGLSDGLSTAISKMPRGESVAWGLPFYVDKPLLVGGEATSISLEPTKCQWLVFRHVIDVEPVKKNDDGFVSSPMRGTGRLGELAANYVIGYADGSEAVLPIRKRHQIASYSRSWGENPFEAVADEKPYAISLEPDDEYAFRAWGWAQQRTFVRESHYDRPFVSWLWAWENPNPRKAIVGIRFEPISGVVAVCGISQGKARSNPLRWSSRQKALLTLTKGETLDPHFGAKGQLEQIQLDMGQIISIVRRPIYPNDSWSKTYNNQVPQLSDRHAIVEYAAHPDATFHLPTGKRVPVANLDDGKKTVALSPIASASQYVTFKAVEKGTSTPVAVKLHIHGTAGEYLPPMTAQRTPNAYWMQDHSVDFSHRGRHFCTYIPGETSLRLPLGDVFVEVSKGFEIRPIRKKVRITRNTKEIVLEIDKVLPWREAGWVSADTHVHVLSPTAALLEGEAEGVNVVNLLASQWGEWMTNVGDFDGKTTHGGGEYVLRVGTENRQHVLGHISLLGYSGNIISPLTTGGAEESAIGDPVEILLTEWAKQCRQADGLAVIPHFPNPRAENAATIVSGNADAVEMTSWGALYNGIDPYSLSDWYRYLNCGYFVAAVGGTDKMDASTAVGTIRTYARLDQNDAFTYDAWKAAIRRGDTFATYGPLLDFSVDGKSPGNRIRMSATGGTVDVQWRAASATLPMSRVELIVNGEIRESRRVKKWDDAGTWSVKLDKSAWCALLVRGHYKDKPEIIAAHSSPVMIDVKGSAFMAAADAVTILEQIEGAMAYLDTIGTESDMRRLKQMRLVLTSAHRELHNKLHQSGQYHRHTPLSDHQAHHE